MSFMIEVVNDKVHVILRTELPELHREPCRELLRG